VERGSPTKSGVSLPVGSDDAAQSRWVSPEQSGAPLTRSIVGTVDRNHVTRWIDSESGHQVATPGDVTAGLAGALVIDVQSGGGLRELQRGALFAALSHWTTGRDDPANIVMPTGTGKTEAMIALYAALRADRLLVLVPSDALRRQIGAKFGTYGVLPSIGVLAEPAPLPFVGSLEHSLSTPEAAVEFARACNVIIATPTALFRPKDAVLEAMFAECSHLFVDEAHHVAAKTWRRVRDAFPSRRVVQFTATPFRTDGKRLGGRTIYEFPLKEAQRLGYFARINYVGLPPSADDDHAVASEAVRRLRDDLANGFDHLLMARVKTKNDAESLHRLYAELAPDLSPQLLHSSLPKSAREEALDALDARSSRVIVCVNMLGEGFDLPELKVAALHDVHRSLGVTLQFVGRFARTVPGGMNDARAHVGEATVIAARSEGQLDDNLRRLYREDSDWNELIHDLSAQRLRQEEEVEEFERGFQGEGEIPTLSIQPKMSTVVFRTQCSEWNLEALAAIFPPERL
jgi:superfamily II DNA or RNA helicase